MLICICKTRISYRYFQLTETNHYVVINANTYEKVPERLHMYQSIKMDFTALIYKNKVLFFLLFYLKILLGLQKIGSF